MKDYVAQFFGGAANMELIMSAENVTACRLTAPRGKDGKPDHQKLRALDTLKHYAPEADAVVPAKLLGELRAVLKDPATNDPASSKACIPIYGVRFTFRQGERTLTVNLCFLCEILATAEADKIIGLGAFDPAAARLMAISQALFPHDSDLRDIR